jgi:cobalt-zinc-cadmium efflux system outer membrane protein
VRQGYFGALVTQQRLAKLEELVAVAHRSEAAAVKFEEAGIGTRGDTLLLTIEMEKAEVGRENVETALFAVRKQLAAIVGQRALDIGDLQGDVAISLAEFGPHVLADGYVPYNADVQIAEQEVERARLLAERARVEPFPNVTLSAGYMYQVAPLHNYGVLEVSVPLPMWNRNQGNIYAAQAAVHRAADTVEQVQNDLAKQMAEAAGRYRQADQLVQRYQHRILPRAQESVKVVESGLRGGESDLLRMLTAQRSLIESELAYLAALEARWNAAADLAGLAQIEAFP